MARKIEVKEYTRLFVEYFYPGILVNESSSQEVEARDAQKCAREIPKGAFMFRFYDVFYMEDAETEEVLNRKRLNESKAYYVDGVALDKEGVKKEIPNNEILLSNMRANGWDKVIKTRTGNIQPLNDDCIIIKVTA